jgi:NitT/TauT family transport system substrate-binding protein
MANSADHLTRASFGRVGLSALGASLVAARQPVLAQSAPIRMGAPASDSFSIVFFAADGGFFQRAGLDVTASVFPGSGPVTTAVAAGALDVGLTDAVQLGNAYIHNIPIGAFAGGGLYETNGDKVTGLCVARDAPYRSPKDFEGQTIGVITLGSISMAAMKAWLTAHAVNLQTIKFVEMPYAEMGPSLARGTVAGAYVAEPVLSQIQPDVRIVASPYDAIGTKLLISLWFGTQEWIAKNHDVAKKLVSAIYDASRWANDHQDLTLPILEKYAKLDVNRVRGMHRTRFATSLDPRLLQPVLDAAATYQLIERPVQAQSVITLV